MAKTVLKTFRLPEQVAKEIEVEAKNRHLSQTQYVVNIVTENKFLNLKKSFDEEVKRMEQDKFYKKKQIDLANADFL